MIKFIVFCILVNIASLLLVFGMIHFGWESASAGYFGGMIYTGVCAARGFAQFEKISKKEK